jgi:hypothetical protein
MDKIAILDLEGSAKLYNQDARVGSGVYVLCLFGEE